MLVQKTVEILELLPRDIATGTVEPLFTVHEDSRILRCFRAYARMRIEKLFEFGMR